MEKRNHNIWEVATFRIYVCSLYSCILWVWCGKHWDRQISYRSLEMVDCVLYAVFLRFLYIFVSSVSTFNRTVHLETNASLLLNFSQIRSVYTNIYIHRFWCVSRMLIDIVNWKTVDINKSQLKFFFPMDNRH